MADVTTYYKSMRSGNLGLGIHAKNKSFHNDYVAVIITSTIPAEKAELLADKIVEWLTESGE